VVEGQGVKWSEVDVAWLRDHYGKMRVMDMVPLLGRSRASISRQCQRLGLSPKRPVWTKAERAKFFAEYGPKSTHQLAAELGKTEAAVRHFASRHKWG